MLKELWNLRGGEKRMWLRQHQEEVLEYLEHHGELATKEKYHLTHDTLDRVISPEGGYYPRFSRYDELQLKLNITEAGVAELRAEVKELKEQFARFQDSVAEQLKQNFFLPLLQAGIRLPGGMDANPGPDRLRISDLMEQALNPEFRRIGSFNLGMPPEQGDNEAIAR